MPYVGPAPNPGQNREVDDISSGFNGSEVNFTLQVNSQNVSPGSPNNIIVSVGGVVQNPGTDYNIAASTITFTTAPANGLSFFGLVLGQQVDIQSLADGASPTMSAPTITGDLSIADKIVHTGDTNTAIRFSAADTVSVETGGSQKLSLGAATVFNESGADVDFRIEGDTDTNLFNLDASADAIGIGAAPITTGPKFEITRSTSDAFVNATDCIARLINSDTSADTNQTSLQFTTKTTSTGADSAIVSQAEDASGNSRLEFWTDVSNGMTEKVVITSAGRVGIGKSVPARKVHIENSTDFGIRITKTGASDAEILNTNSLDLCCSSGGAAGQVIRFLTGADPSNLVEHFRVTGGGHILFHQSTTHVPGLANTTVGASIEDIGAQGSALFVSRGDSISLFLNRNNTGQIVSFRQSGSEVGSISTNGSSLPSDRNFKKNITDLTLGLDFVNTLKPSKFNLKIEEDTDPLLFGLIAQEVEESLTAAGVTKNSSVLCQHNPTESETESDYNLDYGKFIPILINSVKELSAKITTLETKVAALEAA